jgi:subtilisin family serine protease
VNPRNFLPELKRRNVYKVAIAYAVVTWLLMQVASCWAFFQGTSMATPHLARSAAVVRGQHPVWTAAQVPSATKFSPAFRAVTLDCAGALSLESKIRISPERKLTRLCA